MITSSNPASLHTGNRGTRAERRPRVATTRETDQLPPRSANACDSTPPDNKAGTWIPAPKDPCLRKRETAFLYREPSVGKRVEQTRVGSLRAKAARGVLLMIVLNVLGTLLARVIQIVMPLYLLPADFGIFALAVLFSGLLAMFADLGLSTALIPRRERFDEAADTAFTLSLVVALGLVACSIGVGWLASQAYAEPRLGLPVLVLSISLVFQAIAMVPRVVANRALQFGRAAIPDNVGKSIGATLTLGLAIVGFAYWSPVYGTVLGAAVGATMQLTLSAWRPRFRLDPRLARELVRFGQFVMLAVLANFIARSIDNAIVGLVLGVAPLGYYAVAYSWGVYLTSNLTSLLAPVGYPLMAKIADAPARLKRALAENLRYFGYVAYCLTFGIVVFAPDFVSSFYGPTWAPSIVPMQLLAPTGILIGYSAICGNALYALGKSRAVFAATWAEVLALVLLVPPATIFFGLAGTCVAALVGGLVIVIRMGRRVGTLIGFSRSDWNGVTYHAFWAGAAASAVGIGLSLLLPTNVPTLFAEVGLFILTYVVLLQVLTRGSFLADLGQVLRLAVTPRKPEERP